MRRNAHSLSNWSEELNLVIVDSELGLFPGPVTTGEGTFHSSVD